MNLVHYQLIVAAFTFLLAIIRPKVKSAIRIQGLSRRDWSDKNIDSCTIWHPETLTGCVESRIIHLRSKKNNEDVPLLFAICASDLSSKLSFVKPLGVGLTNPQSVRDRLVVVDLKTDSTTVLKLDGFDKNTPFWGQSFDVVQSKSSPNTAVIFAVNHRNGQSAVEKFEYKLGSNNASFLESYTDSKLLAQPAFVFALSDTQFYVSNVFRTSRPLAQLAEAYSQSGLSNIVFFDGSKLEIVIKWQSGPLGITGDRENGSRVIFCESFTGKIIIFERLTEQILENETQQEANIVQSEPNFAAQSIEIDSAPSDTENRIDSGITVTATAASTTAIPTIKHKFKNFIDVGFMPVNVQLLPETDELIVAGFPRARELLINAGTDSGHTMRHGLVAQFSLKHLNFDYNRIMENKDKQVPAPPFIDEFLFVGATGSKKLGLSGITGATFDMDADNIYLSSMLSQSFLRCKKKNHTI